MRSSVQVNGAGCGGKFEIILKLNLLNLIVFILYIEDSEYVDGWVMVF